MMGFAAISSEQILIQPSGLDCMQGIKLVEFSERLVFVRHPQFNHVTPGSLAYWFVGRTTIAHKTSWAVSSVG
ncbi:MAG: hypothetical protein ABSD20_21965 [Terriglobales bacterium]|jgi:hypothetical protein